MRNKLPDAQKHMGPPAESNESIKFIDAWKGNSRLMRGPYIMGDRIYVDTKPRYTELEEIIKIELEKSDIGKNLNQYKGEIKVVSGKDVNKLNVAKKFYSKSLF